MSMSRVEEAAALLESLLMLPSPPLPAPARKTPQIFLSRLKKIFTLIKTRNDSMP